MVEFDFTCKECGNGLECKISYGLYGVGVEIVPCEKCIQSSYDQGYDAGHDNGRD